VNSFVCGRPYQRLQRLKQSGFSLVELLVVVLIIALGFSLVSVSVDDNSALKLQLEAKKFANNTALIAEEAVLNSQQWGVDIFREIENGEDVYGYRWLVRNDQGQWELATINNQQQEFLFAENLAVRLELEGSLEEVSILLKRKVAEENSVVDPENDSISEQEQYEPIKPTIWLLSSGEMSAFNLTLFERDDRDQKIVIIGDEIGRIVVESESSEQ
jgi:general secretion pathway protein H